jgi:membrane protease YdiL (CAAX protease family)
MASVAETPRIYPSIRQSWGIVGIVILMSIAWAPLMMLRRRIGDEAATLIYYVSAFGVSFYIVHSMRKRRLGSSRYDFSIGSWRLVIPLCLGSIALLFGVISPIVGLIPMPGPVKDAIRTMVGQRGVFTFLYFVLAAPILEELIFRGIMLDGLLKRYKPLTAILVSSALFGLAHLNPWQFVTGLVLGCFMGWVYFRSHSVGACILIHMSANFSGYVMRLLAASHTGGAEPSGIHDSYGGGVLRFAAVTAVLLMVAASSVYWLRREFDARQRLLPEPELVIESPPSEVSLPEPTI